MGRVMGMGLPSLGQISTYGLFLFGLSVILNIVLFFIAMVK